MIVVKLIHIGKCIETVAETDSDAVALFIVDTAPCGYTQSSRKAHHVEFRHQIIRQLVRGNGWTVSRASAALGLDPSTGAYAMNTSAYKARRIARG